MVRHREKVPNRGVVFSLAEVAAQERQLRISRPLVEEDNRKCFRDDHKSKGVLNAGLPDSEAFEEAKDPQITEEETVLAYDAPTARNSMMSAATRAQTRELLDTDQRVAFDGIERSLTDKSKMMPKFKIDHFALEPILEIGLDGFVKEGGTSHGAFSKLYNVDTDSD